MSSERERFPYCGGLAGVVMSIQPPHVQVGIMDADVSLDTTDGYYR